MAKFDKAAVQYKMGETGMVPVFYNGDPGVAKEVVRACYNGGLRAFEFTNRGDFAHEVFSEVIKFVRKEYPDMAFGAGTVVDPATAALFIQCGADFIVGPCFNPETARICNRRGVAYIPGCATVTEVGNAQEAGCDLIKVFPGDVLGPRFVKDILGPMPWTKIMVTGGVEPTRENLDSWFGAGAFCVGMGSKLFPRDVIERQDWTSIYDTLLNLRRASRK